MRGIGRLLHVLALMVFAGLTGVAVFSALTLNACSPGACTQSGATRDLPSSSIECPAGSVCYLGSCVQACTAGSERQQRCSADSECKDPVQPYCVLLGGTDRFCSACGIGSVCLPDLNICGLTRPAELGDASVLDTSFTNATPPLDGGAIDGSIFTFDAGRAPPPVTIPITHIGEVELAEVVKQVQGGITGSTLTVSVFDVRTATRTPPSTVSGCLIDGMPNKPCDINEVDAQYKVTLRERYEGRIPADIGAINIKSDDNGLNGVVYKAQFVSAPVRGYEVRPIPTTPVLAFPTRDMTTNMLNLKTFTVDGPGKQGLNRTWPNRTTVINIPVEFKPSLESLGILSTEIDAASLTGALVFTWNKGDRVPLTRVRLRIVGPSYELTALSDLNEERALFEIPLMMLDVMRSDPELVNTTDRGAWVYFERIGGQKVDTQSNTAAGIRIELQAEVRHTFVGRMRL